MSLIEPGALANTSFLPPGVVSAEVWGHSALWGLRRLSGEPGYASHPNQGPTTLPLRCPQKGFYYF